MSEQVALDNLIRKFNKHTEDEGKRWKELTGNGEPGLFERVRNLERWAQVQQRIGWIILSTTLLLAMKALWEIFTQRTL